MFTIIKMYSATKVFVTLMDVCDWCVAEVVFTCDVSTWLLTALLSWIFLITGSSPAEQLLLRLQQNTGCQVLLVARGQTDILM